MSESIYRFASFELDAEAAELWKASQRLSVRPKCFDLLLYLVRHARTLVTMETLLMSVWKDVAVVQGTLTRTIAELRAVLGDDPQVPRFIETVARRGYKFVADVEHASADASVPARAARFVVISEGKSFPLEDGEHTIGRSVHSRIAMPDIKVSRVHAKLRVHGNDVAIEDAGSRNGTFVNGRRITAFTRVCPGDKISIGERTLVLWICDRLRTAPGLQSVP